MTLFRLATNVLTKLARCDGGSPDLEAYRSRKFPAKNVSIPPPSFFHSIAERLLIDAMRYDEKGGRQS